MSKTIPDEQNNPDHDPHSAGMYRAMALRFFCRYVDMRRAAEFRGGDLEEHAPLCSELEAGRQYQAAVNAWLWESPDTADAIHSLVEFAGAIAADRLVGEVLHTGGPVADEIDAFHQVIALTAAAGWLNERGLKEWLGRRRAAYGPSAMSPKEVAR